MARMMKSMKRGLAALLAVCMVVTSFNGVSWGAVRSTDENGTMDAYFELDPQYLKEEAQRAVVDGIRYNGAFDPDSLIFEKNGDSGLASSYNELFNDEAGAFYELDLFSTINLENDPEWTYQVPDGATLRIFMQADPSMAQENAEKVATGSNAEETEVSYTLTGKEKMVFLYINSSEDDLVFKVQIGGRYLPIVKVPSKTSMEAKKATASNSDSPVSAPGNGGASSSTNGNGNGMPSDTINQPTESAPVESSAQESSAEASTEALESSTEASESSEAETTTSETNEGETSASSEAAESSSEETTEASTTEAESQSSAEETTVEETTAETTVEETTTEAETVEETTEAAETEESKPEEQPVETKEVTEPESQEPVITMSRNDVPRVGTPTAGEISDSEFNSPEEEWEALHGDDEYDENSSYPGSGSSNIYVVENEETDNTISGTVYEAVVIKEKVGFMTRLFETFSGTDEAPTGAGVTTTSGEATRAAADGGDLFRVDLYDYNGITKDGKNIGKDGQYAYNSPINRALLGSGTDDVFKGNEKIKNHLAFGLGGLLSENGHYNSYKTGNGQINITQGLAQTYRDSNKKLQFNRIKGSEDKDPVSGFNLFPNTYSEYNEVTNPMWTYLGVNAKNFFVNEENHYSYDSTQYKAILQEEQNEDEKKTYTLVSEAADRNDAGNIIDPGFWPLDGYNVPYKNDHNYFFGMHVGFEFALSPDGMFNDDEMVFNFRGDDDVWVYLTKKGDESDTGRLALDIGGIHDAMEGNINFATGEITYSHNVKNNKNSAVGYIFNENTKQFEKNQGEIKWYLYTADDALREYNEKHPGASATMDDINNMYDRFVGLERGVWNEYTLDFYYLERGGYASNCKLDFVLPVLPENSVMVTKQVQGQNANTIDPTTKYPMELFVDGKSFKEFALGANESISIPVSPNAKEFYVVEKDNKDASSTLWGVGSRKISGTKSPVGKVGVDKMAICANVYDEISPNVNKTAILDPSVDDKAVYDVTLSVEGDSVTVTTEGIEKTGADVLFVVDISNSMLWAMDEKLLDKALNPVLDKDRNPAEPEHPTDGTSRWDTLVGSEDKPGILWQTIENLIGKEANSKNRVGIVCYAGMKKNGNNGVGVATVPVTWTNSFETCKTEFLNKPLIALNNDKGGTNAKVGFTEALNQMDKRASGSSKNEKSFIIYISDGLPTQYNTSDSVVNSGNIRDNFYTVIKNGKDNAYGLTTVEIQEMRAEFDYFNGKRYTYDKKEYTWSSEDPNWSHIVKSTSWKSEDAEAKYKELPFLYMFRVCGKEAISEAIRLKAKYNDTEIYTVGMSKTLSERPELVKFSLNPSGTQQYQKEYYPAADAAKLLKVFEGLTQTIQNSTVYAATDLNVTDQLTDKVDFVLDANQMPILSVGGEKLTGILNGDKVIYSSTSENNIVTVDLVDKTISWKVSDKLAKGSTKALSYRIYVNDNAVYHEDGTQYPNWPDENTGTHADKNEKGYLSNKKPILSYKDELTEVVKKIPFPHPVVRPLKKGTLTITKRLADSDIKPDENASFNFKVKLTGITGSTVIRTMGGEVKTFDVSADGTLEDEITLGVDQRCEYTGLNKEVQYEITEVLSAPGDEDIYDVSLDSIRVSVGGGAFQSMETVNKQISGSLSDVVDNGQETVGYTEGNVVDEATSWEGAGFAEKGTWVADPVGVECIQNGGLWWRNNTGELKSWDEFVTVDNVYGNTYTAEKISGGSEYKLGDYGPYNNIEELEEDVSAKLKDSEDIVKNHKGEGYKNNVGKYDHITFPFTGNDVTVYYKITAEEDDGDWIILDEEKLNDIKEKLKESSRTFENAYNFEKGKKGKEYAKSESYIIYSKTLKIEEKPGTSQWQYTDESGNIVYADGNANIEEKIRQQFSNEVEINVVRADLIEYRPLVDQIKTPMTAAEIRDLGYTPVKYTIKPGTDTVLANVDVIFTNKYSKAPKASLSVTKKVTGQTAPTEGKDYGFAIYKKDASDNYQLFTDYTVGDNGAEPVSLMGEIYGFLISGAHLNQTAQATIHFNKRSEAGDFKIVEVLRGEAMSTVWDSNDLGDASASFELNSAEDKVGLTCTNNYWDQELIIAKEVNGTNPYPDAFYKFNVKLTDSEEKALTGTLNAVVISGTVKTEANENATKYTEETPVSIPLVEGEFSVYLSAGASLKLLDVPNQTNYSVEEELANDDLYYNVELVKTFVNDIKKAEDSTGKALNPLTGMLNEATNKATLKFVNKYTAKTMSLKLTKKLVDDKGNPKADTEAVTFLFKITNKDVKSPGYNKDVENTFYRRLTIPAGQTEMTIVITDLPVSTEYEIQEMDHMRYQLVGKNDKIVSVSGPTEAVFENKKVNDSYFSSTSVVTNKVNGQFKFKQHRDMPQDEVQNKVETVVAALPPKVKTSNFDSDGYDDGDTQLV